jgi:hypothetical protein
MDALSDLLRVLRFSGGLFLETKFRAPWCVRAQISPEDGGPGVNSEGDLAAFHYILEGRVQVRLGKERPRSAGPGELILLARNDSHLLGSDVTLPPIEGRTFGDEPGQADRILERTWNRSRTTTPASPR